MFCLLIDEAGHKNAVPQSDQMLYFYTIDKSWDKIAIPNWRTSATEPRKYAKEFGFPMFFPQEWTNATKPANWTGETWPPKNVTKVYIGNIKAEEEEQPRALLIDEEFASWIHFINHDEKGSICYYEWRRCGDTPVLVVVASQGITQGNAITMTWGPGDFELSFRLR